MRGRLFFSSGWKGLGPSQRAHEFVRLHPRQGCDCRAVGGDRNCVTGLTGRQHSSRKRDTGEKHGGAANNQDNTPRQLWGHPQFEKKKKKKKSSNLDGRRTIKSREEKAAAGDEFSSKSWCSSSAQRMSTVTSPFAAPPTVPNHSFMVRETSECTRISSICKFAGPAASEATGALTVTEPSAGCPSRLVQGTYTRKRA
jgi:hypothetical protein